MIPTSHPLTSTGSSRKQAKASSIVLSRLTRSYLNPHVIVRNAKERPHIYNLLGCFYLSPFYYYSRFSLGTCIPLVSTLSLSYIPMAVCVLGRVQGLTHIR